MRGSAQSQGVVNMRGHDSKLADFALKKYVFLFYFRFVLSIWFRVIQHITESNASIPQGLIFTKRL